MSVAKDFNVGHNFWNVRERDFIFGMHTQLMKSLKMEPRSETFIKITNLDFVVARGIHVS